MLSNNLTVIGSGSIAKTFNLRTISPDGEVIRSDSAAGLSTPRTLTTSSVKKGAPGKEYQRVYVRFDFSEGPDLSGHTPVVSGHMVLNVPLTVSAPTKAEDIRVLLANLMSAANLTLMLNGEV